MTHEYLRSCRFDSDSPEPVPQTVIMLQAIKWGVAFRRCQDGLWYTAGQHGGSLTWDDVLLAIEGAEVFVLGPEHSYLPVKYTAQSG